MKTNVRKALAIMLTFLMAFSCFSIAASAATKDTVTKYGEEGGYLAIGDSISRGCGAEGFYLNRYGETVPGGEDNDQYDDYQVRNVQGCLPYQIAQAVGCNAPFLMDEDVENATYWPFAFPGMTTAAALDLYGVDDNYDDTTLRYDYYDSMLEYFGYKGDFSGAEKEYKGSFDGFVPTKYTERLETAKSEGNQAKIDELEAKIAGYKYNEGKCGKCGNIIEYTQRADLITVQLGMCDVFYRAYRIVNNGGMLKDGFNLDLSNVSGIAELVTTAVAEMWNGYEYWKNNFSLLLDTIKDLNPDATVVIVGAFNVVNELTITDDLLLPIGTAFSLITESMNEQYKKLAKEYGYLYADVSATETQAAENDWSVLGDFMKNTFTGTHPTQKGYDYMARQILAVLPYKEGTKDICVDLGRFENVDYVLLDGKFVSKDNYSMNDFVLTIPYSGMIAKNLTIGVKNDDGTISVQTYSLKFDSETGYTSYRIYGNNDVSSIFRKPFEIIKMLFNKIIDAIKGLFKK